MKVVKAKYYKETNEIIPLDPQPKRKADGAWDYERLGVDEKGEFNVIDFITEESHFFEYDISDGTINKELKETTEEEWNKTETLDIETMDSILQGNVENAAVNTSQESVTTSTKMNPQTSLTETGKSMSTIGQLFYNAYNAIIKSFQR
jgi:hypothetical protein